MITKTGIFTGYALNENGQNYNIIGSPIISNKILSGTTKGNYISFDISTSTDIEFRIGFKFKTVSQAYNGLISRGTPGFQFYTKNGTNSLIMELFGNTQVLSFSNLVIDIDYILSFSYSGSTFTATLSSSASSETKTGSYSNFDMSGTWRLGVTQSGNYGYDGLIYLEQLLVKSNGETYAPSVSTCISDYQISCEEFYEI